MARPEHSRPGRHSLTRLWSALVLCLAVALAFGLPHPQTPDQSLLHPMAAHHTAHNTPDPQKTFGPCVTFCALMGNGTMLAHPVQIPVSSGDLGAVFWARAGATGAATLTIEPLARPPNTVVLA